MVPGGSSGHARIFLVIGSDDDFEPFDEPFDLEAPIATISVELDIKRGSGSSGFKAGIVDAGGALISAMGRILSPVTGSTNPPEFDEASALAACG